MVSLNAYIAGLEADHSKYQQRGEIIFWIEDTEFRWVGSAASIRPNVRWQHLGRLRVSARVGDLNSADATVVQALLALQKMY